MNKNNRASLLVMLIAAVVMFGGGCVVNYYMVQKYPPQPAPAAHPWAWGAFMDGVDSVRFGFKPDPANAAYKAFRFQDSIKRDSLKRRAAEFSRPPKPGGF